MARSKERTFLGKRNRECKGQDVGPKKSPVFIPYLSEQDLKCSFRPCLVTLEGGKHLYSILGIETKVWGFLISSVSCSMSQGQGAQTRRPKTGIPIMCLK